MLEIYLREAKSKAAFFLLGIIIIFVAVRFFPKQGNEKRSERLIWTQEVFSPFSSRRLFVAQKFGLSHDKNGIIRPQKRPQQTQAKNSNFL